MNAIRTALVAVAIGAITVFTPLPGGWKMVGGILSLMLAVATVIMARKQSSAQ